MADSIVGHGFQVLDITAVHTERVTKLPFPIIGGTQHRDPFDRLLVCQAKAEGMSIVSNDGTFPAYAVPIIW
jgi:PIN domain nuclease of toxin-antitoxin system